MDPQLRTFVQSVLERERDLTIATLRPDGYPQANTVSYVSDGLATFFCEGNEAAVPILRSTMASWIIGEVAGEGDTIRTNSDRIIMDPARNCTVGRYNLT